MVLQVGSASEINIKNKFMQFLDKTKIYHTVNNDFSVLQSKPCYCKISDLKVCLYSELTLFRNYLYMQFFVVFVGFFWCVCSSPPNSTFHSVKWLIYSVRRNTGLGGIFWSIESCSPLLQTLLPYNVSHKVIKLHLNTSVGFTGGCLCQKVV